MSHDIYIPLPGRLVKMDRRPSPEVRADRTERFINECNANREHIAKTRKLNMIACHSHFEHLDSLTHKTQPNANTAVVRAAQVAAEMYGCRQFVLGVIVGRGHMLPERELEELKHAWEDEWDTAFGDLVGTVLKLNVAL